jgi:hypothetical protein
MKTFLRPGCRDERSSLRVSLYALNPFNAAFCNCFECFCCCFVVSQIVGLLGVLGTTCRHPTYAYGFGSRVRHCFDRHVA